MQLLVCILDIKPYKLLWHAAKIIETEVGRLSIPDKKNEKNRIEWLEVQNSLVCWEGQIDKIYSLQCMSYGCRLSVAEATQPARSAQKKCFFFGNVLRKEKDVSYFLE